MLTEKERQERLAQIIASLTAGLSDTEISRKSGVSREWVRKLRIKYGIAKKETTYAHFAPAIRPYYDAGKSCKEIAAILGCGSEIVYQWLRKHDLKRNEGKRRFLKQEEEERRLALYYQGLNDTQLAKEIGRGLVAVGKWRKLRNLPINPTEHTWAKKRNTDNTKK